MFVISCIATILGVIAQNGDWYRVEFYIRTSGPMGITVTATLKTIEGHIDMPQEQKEYTFVGMVVDSTRREVDVQQLLQLPDDVKTRGAAKAAAQVSVSGIVARTSNQSVNVLYKVPKEYGDLHQRVIGSQENVGKEWNRQRRRPPIGAVVTNGVTGGDCD
ncbi:hypothetical protein DFS34DRAFT_627502 [Phlyctochytrium arcticum]|nr:hypothetical protein DFS34DRAFT_627502 [Phlyctochytrium arcticum]